MINFKTILQGVERVLLDNLTGYTIARNDPRNTDPACALSPYHNEMVALAKKEAAKPATEFVYRNPRNVAKATETQDEPLVPAE